MQYKSVRQWQQRQSRPMMNIEGESFPKVITTSNTEIDKNLGGGIPRASMHLVEGESDSGKSVLTQQLV